MQWLKADLHAHTADDPRDGISYSTEMLIDRAAQLNFQALAVTCHERNAYCPRLAEYAKRRGIVLVPGIELMVEGKHVLVLNPDEEQAGARTFAELRALGPRKAAIIAPHPFYPARKCLRGQLAKNLDLFDGIEYCSVYCRGLNLNRRAVRMARRFNRPLIGTSDAHGFRDFGNTFSWVHAHATVESVIEAIREGRVRLDTRPHPVLETAHRAVGAATHFVREVAAMWG